MPFAFGLLGRMIRGARKKRREALFISINHPRASWACESGFPHWRDSDRLPPERNVRAKFALGQEAPFRYYAGTLVLSPPSVSTRRVQSWVTKPSPALLGRPCPSINTTQRTAIQFALSTKVPCAFFSRHASSLPRQGNKWPTQGDAPSARLFAHANVRTCAPTPASDHGEIKHPILNVDCRQ
jgi:hypothetical protein